jgi:endonuclease IV
MQGKLVKCLTGWKVFYNKYTGVVTQDPYHLLHNLPLHPDDTEDVESHWESLDEARKKVAETVEFEIVKKFMADETLCYAKLTKETNKETLYTEEQVREAINTCHQYIFGYNLIERKVDEIIQSLKQSNKNTKQK